MSQSVCSDEPTVSWEIREGDALDELREMPAESVQTCVTSPPYFGLRDYGADGQIGLEATPDEYVMRLVDVFREVRRVLRMDGTLWLNIGDSYASSAAGRTQDGFNARYSGAMIGKPASRHQQQVRSPIARFLAIASRRTC